MLIINTTAQEAGRGMLLKDSLENPGKHNYPKNNCSPTFPSQGATGWCASFGPERGFKAAEVTLLGPSQPEPTGQWVPGEGWAVVTWAVTSPPWVSQGTKDLTNEDARVLLHISKNRRRDRSNPGHA